MSHAETKFRVFVGCDLPEETIAAMDRLGFTLRVEKEIPKDGTALETMIPDFQPDALVVRRQMVSPKTLEGIREEGTCGLVIRAGGGTDNIDRRAWEMNIAVAKCPGGNSASVAQHAFGLINAMDRSLPEHLALTRQGRDSSKELPKARGLQNLKLGVLGLGEIGRRVARLGLAYEMEVIGWNRSLSLEVSDHLLEADPNFSRLGVKDMDLSSGALHLAEHCHVICLHLALAAETEGIWNESFFDRLMPGTILCSTSRPGLIDEAALLAALNDQRGIKACLDDISSLSSPLASHDSCMVTPHLGASSLQSEENTGRIVVDILKQFRESGGRTVLHRVEG